MSELGYWNIVLSDNEVSGDVIFKRLNENYGIGPFLKDVISSVDTKCCKPSSVFFNFAFLFKYEKNRSPIWQPNEVMELITKILKLKLFVE